MQYLIDYSGWFSEGGYCQVYSIKDEPKLIFKEFRNKKKAKESFAYQKRLSRYDLAPKIYGGICRMNFAPEEDSWIPENTDWGYVVELAKVYASEGIHKNKTMITMKDIQDLVEEIHAKTGLKFWDCHWSNIGVVKRNKKKRVVCIDTGKESFSGDCNAWGFADPGPKCGYCNKYQCKCSEY
jgi:hypothetical protein